MSNGAAARRVSRQDIQLVQNLIERCLQLYMSQKEVVDTLLVQAKIEPGFTELVWQKLEEENREFFKAYYLRLLVKHQILEFNKLLDQQAQLLRHINPTGVAPMPTSNGSNTPSLHQNSTCYALEHTGLAPNPENIHCSVGSIMINAFRNGGSSLPNAFNNGGSSLNRSIHGALGMPGHASRIAAPLNMLPNQNSNIGLVSGMNGAMIKSEAGYSGNSSYTFCADENVLETHPMAGDASASYSNIESGAQPLNDSLLDADTSPFGFLGQIPRSFSLTDLTAEYSQSSDILESYPRSPFLSTDTNDFMESRERIEHPGDNRRLDTISEGLSLEDFGSE